MLRRRLDAGWDAAVVMLGSNYGEDPVFYGAELNRLIEDLAPRPVVLVNVTEFKPDRAEVNYLINLAADAHDNVRVVDWASRTRDSDEFVGDDGLHLSELGREELAGMIATALGRAPPAPTAPASAPAEPPRRRAAARRTRELVIAASQRTPSDERGWPRVNT